MSKQSKMLAKATFYRVILKGPKSSIVICPGILVVMPSETVDEFVKTPLSELNMIFTAFKDSGMNYSVTNHYQLQIIDLIKFLTDNQKNDRFYNFDGFEGLLYQECHGGAAKTILSVSLNSGEPIGDEFNIFSYITGFLGACCSHGLCPDSNKPGNIDIEIDYFERCYLNHRDKDFRLFNTKKSYYYKDVDDDYLSTFKVLDWVSRGYNSYSDYNIAITTGYDDVDWDALAECTVFANHARGVRAYLTGDYKLI